MRHLFICALLCVLPISPLAQTAGSFAEQRQAQGEDLSTNSARVLDWANRLTARDPKVRAIAEAALVRGAGRSLPLLRQLLKRGDEDLDLRTFEIIRRIGPPAIPLLVELLGHEQVSFRRDAADSLIDLVPDTERIQAALRRALRDEDAMVAGDAARALGALGPKASPSVRALVTTLSHEDPVRACLRGGGPGVRRSEGGRGDQGPRRSLGRSGSRRPMGGGRGPGKHRPGRATPLCLS